MIEADPRDPVVATWHENRALTFDKETLLVDLDGTLTNPEHRRHHLRQKVPDWYRFSVEAGKDLARLTVIEYVNARHSYMNVVNKKLRKIFYSVREIENGNIKNSNLEAWFNSHVWNMIVDQAFGDLDVVCV